VLLWFAGLAVVVVWQVFHDPAIDYRLVVVGALLPDLVDAAAGGPGLPHTLVFSAALLAAVMVGTRGRRPLRRRLLALPIGTFLHLVLDGIWARSHTFWWPFLGTSFTGSRLPSFDRPVPVLVLQEAAGVAALVWCWRRFRLKEPDRWARLLRTGRLGRDVGGRSRTGES
jgi:membrane-bound metal-dependent hydrolase YbcI (DUF457 family)